MMMKRVGTCVSRLLIAALLLGNLCGCSLTLATLANSREAHREKQTRREAITLLEPETGSTITVKPRGSAIVVGQFVGIMTTDGTDGDTALTEILVLKRSWRRIEIPVRDIAWVQDRSPRWTVPVAFGLGLAVDFTMLWYIAQGFSGMPS